jgi:hypothetical protein
MINYLVSITGHFLLMECPAVALHVDCGVTVLQSQHRQSSDVEVSAERDLSVDSLALNFFSAESTGCYRYTIKLFPSVVCGNNTCHRSPDPCNTRIALIIAAYSYVPAHVKDPLCARLTIVHDCVQSTNAHA